MYDEYVEKQAPSNSNFNCTLNYVLCSLCNHILSYWDAVVRKLVKRRKQDNNTKTKETLDTVTCFFCIADAVDTCGNYFINPLECFYFQEMNCTKLITTTPAPVTTPAPSKLLLHSLKLMLHLHLDK